MKNKCALTVFSLHGEEAGEMFILDDNGDSVPLMTQGHLNWKIPPLDILKLKPNNLDKTALNELVD